MNMSYSAMDREDFPFSNGTKAKFRNCGENGLKVGGYWSTYIKPGLENA